MLALLVVAFVLWSARKSSGSALRVAGDGFRREAAQHREAIERDHPDWTPRRRNRLAMGRAIGATGADLFHLGPAMGRALRRGWSDARAEWGATREEHEAWRRARFGDLAERRASRDGTRPSPWRRAGRRAWAMLLGPVPQAAFIPAPPPPRNVVPFPGRPPGPGSPDPANPAQAAPAQPGSNPAHPGSAGPAQPGSPRLTGPGSAGPAQPGSRPGSAGPAQPGSRPGSAGPAQAEAAPGSDPANPAPGPGPARPQEPAGTPETAPAPAPAGTGTETATGETDMANLTGETGSYEATNAALDGFAEAAAETLTAAENTSTPVVAQAAAAVAAAERLSASLGALGMKDETLNASVAHLAGTAADLRAKADEMNRVRLEVMELAMKLDADARAAKATHVQGQGAVGEAINATGGTADDANAYFGR